MNLENALDKAHAFITQNIWLQLFTVFTRIILAVGFIPPSLKKIFGQPFTILPDSHPVGRYFNALYQTGFYYEFLGWAQFVAAVLLLYPAHGSFRCARVFPRYSQHRRADQFGRIRRHEIHHDFDAARLHLSSGLGIRPLETARFLDARQPRRIAELRFSVASFAVRIRRRVARLLFRLCERRQYSSKIHSGSAHRNRRRIRLRRNLFGSL